MMMYKDFSGRTVIALAAGSFGKGTFDSVFAAAKKLLSPAEVHHPLYLTKTLYIYRNINSC